MDMDTHETDMNSEKETLEKDPAAVRQEEQLAAQAGLNPEAAPSASDTLSTEALEEKVEEVLEKIRPYIQHDGGDIELLGVDENSIVYVSFIGACAGCAMAGDDFSGGVTLLLLDEIPEIKDVVLIG